MAGYCFTRLLKRCLNRNYRRVIRNYMNTEKSRNWKLANRITVGCFLFIILFFLAAYLGGGGILFSIIGICGFFIFVVLMFKYFTVVFNDWFKN